MVNCYQLTKIINRHGLQPIVKLLSISDLNNFLASKSAVQEKQVHKKLGIFN